MKQFIAACNKQDHPGCEHIDKLPFQYPRKMKNTALITQGQNVAERFSTEASSQEYKKIIKEIHTETVQHVIANYKVNRVLQTPLPKYNKEETKLPRSTRVELSRLRSGFSRKLNEYLYRIGEPETELCPKGPNAPQPLTPPPSVRMSAQTHQPFSSQPMDKAHRNRQFLN